MSSAKTRDIAPGASRKLKGLLDKLEKQYDTLKMLPDVPALEQAIYLILREKNDYRKAARALKILTEEYVEWNELRVATPKEIVAVLAECGLADLDDKISRILALLSRLFYDFHKKDLQFVRIFEAPQRQKIMLSLDPLPAHITYVLLQHFEDTSLEPGGLVVSPTALNTVTKLGLVRKTNSMNVAKKLLERLVGEDDVYRFHYLIHRYQD